MPNRDYPLLLAIVVDWSLYPSYVGCGALHPPDVGVVSPVWLSWFLSLTHSLRTGLHQMICPCVSENKAVETLPKLLALQLIVVASQVFVLS